MTTVEELVKEIGNSKELQEEIRELKDDRELEAFLKRHDCNATAQEYFDYLESSEEGELSDDDAEAAAGGKGPSSQRPHYTPPYKTPPKTPRLSPEVINPEVIQPVEQAQVL